MKTLIIVISIFIISSLCFSQPQKGNIGLSASIQNSQIDFLIPIFASDNFAISPSVGISSISDQFTDLSVGALMRFYLSKNIVSPYIGFRLGAMILSPKGGDSQTDYILGPCFGGEYYFSQHFSAGIELQLNIARSGEHSMRFNNPNGTNIGTTSAFYATIYF
jgi:hypothetical protein